jgi:hypothetical protein
LPADTLPLVIATTQTGGRSGMSPAAGRRIAAIIVIAT